LGGRIGDAQNPTKNLTKNPTENLGKNRTENSGGNSLGGRIGDAQNPTKNLTKNPTENLGKNSDGNMGGNGFEKAPLESGRLLASGAVRGLVVAVGYVVVVIDTDLEVGCEGEVGGHCYGAGCAAGVVIPVVEGETCLRSGFDFDLGA